MIKDYTIFFINVYLNIKIHILLIRRLAYKNWIICDWVWWVIYVFENVMLIVA